MKVHAYWMGIVGMLSNFDTEINTPISTYVPTGLLSGMPAIVTDAESKFIGGLKGWSKTINILRSSTNSNLFPWKIHWQIISEIILNEYINFQDASDTEIISLCLKCPK